MFRPRVPQGSLLESEFLVPPAKAKRLQKTWAEGFRGKALPLIDEGRFAHMYCEDTGRPNRAVQTVLGVLILKDSWDLTDEEASNTFREYAPSNTFTCSSVNRLCSWSILPSFWEECTASLLLRNYQSSSQS